MGGNNHKEDVPASSEHSVLAVVLEELRSLSLCQKGTRSDLQAHTTQEELWKTEIITKIDKLSGAFPDEDTRGHREYHDALIAAAQQRVKLRQAIIEKSLTALIWAGIVWIGIAAWHAFKHALGLG